MPALVQRLARNMPEDEVPHIIRSIWIAEESIGFWDWYRCVCTNEVHSRRLAGRHRANLDNRVWRQLDYGTGGLLSMVDARCVARGLDDIVVGQSCRQVIPTLTLLTRLARRSRGGPALTSGIRRGGSEGRLCTTVR